MTNSVENPSHSSGSPYLPRTRCSGDFRLNASAGAAFFLMLHLLQAVTKFVSTAAPPNRDITSWRDQVLSIGWDDIRQKYGSPFPIPAEMQAGAIHPGGVYHWSQPLQPNLVAVSVTVAAVIFLGPSWEGDRELVNKLLSDRLKMSAEFAYWAARLDQASDIGAVERLANQAGRDKAEGLKATRHPHPMVLAAMEGSMRTMPMSVRGGLYSEADGLAYLRAHAHRMAEVTAAEGKGGTLQWVLSTDLCKRLQFLSS